MSFVARRTRIVAIAVWVLNFAIFAMGNKFESGGLPIPLRGTLHLVLAYLNYLTILMPLVRR